VRSILKIVLSVIFSLVFISCNKGLDRTKILIYDVWKFKLSDDPLGSKINLNDKKWDTIHIGNFGFNRKFYKYDGYAWYRTKVFIPSEIKGQGFKDSLKIFLGSIDDCDQVFLNGELIGEDGVTIKNLNEKRPYFESLVGIGSRKRNYRLSILDKRIKWDKENVIAIRIYDQYGNGGMYNSIPYISMVGLEDYLQFDKSKFYKIDSTDNLDKKLIVKNVSQKLLIEGILNTSVISVETKNTIFKQEHLLKLKPQESRSFSIKLPISTDPIVINFYFKDKNLKMEMNEIDSIPYVLEL